MNTVIMVLNDMWHEAEDNPEKFVDQITHGINGYKYDYPQSPNVMSPIHSSELRAYIAGGNTITDLSNIRELMQKGAYDYVDEIISELEDSLERVKRDRNDYLRDNDPLYYKAKKVVDSENE